MGPWGLYGVGRKGHHESALAFESPSGHAVDVGRSQELLTAGTLLFQWTEYALNEGHCRHKFAYGEVQHTTHF